jgi:hypothetical protein
VSRSGDNYQLREQQTAYSPLFTRENSSLSDDNTYFWDESDVM